MYTYRRSQSYLFDNKAYRFSENLLKSLRSSWGGFNSRLFKKNNNYTE